MNRCDSSQRKEEPGFMVRRPSGPSTHWAGRTFCCPFLSSHLSAAPLQRAGTALNPFIGSQRRRKVEKYNYWVSDLSPARFPVCGVSAGTKITIHLALIIP